ncbi:LuxR C-terminal-related transcriptional regulator [Xylanimonas protaetiae]|uniref:HTH luxR-type domain-containing protein n=1 Tax=Xylanimonas protaetiae TaxID=2509457 RepID=A0A4P6FDW9_9MICO|nr:LuxR C-terminal-related transcriptional regulator [Xylanimonas protaetiae]QAY68788.1 hypothetical protein ET471_00935 [Xylanimonas protaetiae]
MERIAGIVVPSSVGPADTVSATSDRTFADVGYSPSAGDLRLSGADEIRTCLREISATASERVDSLIPTVPSTEALTSSLASDLRMVERGVRLRSLFPDHAKEATRITDYAEHVGRYGVEVRHGAVGQVRMVLFDSSVAVISAVTSGSSATPAALVTRTSGVISAMSSYFALLWARSGTISTDAAIRPGAAREASILAAVIAGKTDRAIAREHGVDERTVQRTLSTLRQRYGVNSRYQLVAEAVARGRATAT